MKAIITNESKEQDSLDWSGDNKPLQNESGE
jgi:hypothetical protein